MKPSDQIIILPSFALSEMRLGSLVGMTATIAQVVEKSGYINGCWVDLQVSYLGEREWYIPYNSIGI